jgi:hypothetical protein
MIIAVIYKKVPEGTFLSFRTTKDTLATQHELIPLYWSNEAGVVISMFENKTQWLMDKSQFVSLEKIGW